MGLYISVIVLVDVRPPPDAGLVVKILDPRRRIVTLPEQQDPFHAACTFIR
jgi:hypothetical protein